VKIIFCGAAKKISSPLDEIQMAYHIPSASGS
jgi:hypothetical protein